MSWLYQGTLPSVEDESRYNSPTAIVGDEDEEESLPPYDRGYEDRICCRERKAPYRYAEAKDEWLRGWDAADNESEEGDL